MATENEPAKLLLPYLQRADELQKHEPLVAYYCRLFAMERGLKIPQSERTKTTNSILMSLINQLEKDKKSLKLSPDDNLHLEGFALNVFAKADKQDRAGRADLNTAKTFYAASIFFDILNQFGPLAADLEQKQKYAVWKAADIRKALKEGRKPNPGPPADDEDFSALASTPSMAHELRPSETAVTSPRSEPDPSSQFHNKVNQHSAEIQPQHQFQDDINRQHSTDIPPSQFHNSVNSQYSTDIPPPSQFHDNVNILPSSSSYPTSSYPAHDLPPPANIPDNTTYSQSYHYQSYPQEPQQHPQHNYPSHENPNYNYPNFQSYPSFAESSLPAAPAHYPSFYQSADTYPSHSAPQSTSYSSTTQYSPTSQNGTTSDPGPTPAQKYQYDSNYQPPPEKIAEAHKAARFAVGALAFDDVFIAVDYLKKSLELLTNPSPSN